ncbi:MAG: hypothetical protein ACXIVE_16160, partial [Salinarimonas sp.]
MIDPGDPEQGNPGGIRAYLRFDEVGPQGGIFMFPLSDEALLAVTLPARYLTSPVPLEQDPALFANDGEYASYLQAHAEIHGTLSVMEARQLAILTGGEAPDRPAGATRFDGAMNQLFEAAAAGVDTVGLDTLRLLGLLADGIPIFPIVTLGGPGMIVDPSRSGGQTLMESLGLRAPGDEALPVAFDNMIQDGFRSLGVNPESPEFQETRRALEIVALITTGAYLTDAALRLFHRPGGALMLQIDIPPGALVAPGDIGRTATALRSLAGTPNGGAALHPETLSQLQRLALQNPDDPASNELYQAASRLLQGQSGGNAGLRAHAYLLSGGDDPAALRQITQAYRNEAGIPLDEVARRGQALQGQLNALPAPERLNLLAQADPRDLSSLDPSALSPPERAVVAARIAQQTPPTNYVSLD